MTERTAVYAGSFDPITYGHLDLIERGLEVFDRIVITLARNPRKSALFTVEERQALIRGAVAHLDGRAEVTSFQGLLVDYVNSIGAKTMLRGMRALTDFEYEFQFAHMNKRLAPEIDTVFLVPSEQHFFISSSLVKEVAAFGGALQSLVPENVARALKEKFQ